MCLISVIDDSLATRLDDDDDDVVVDVVDVGDEVDDDDYVGACLDCSLLGLEQLVILVMMMMMVLR